MSRHRLALAIWEILSDVYGKRQTSDSSWEFLKIENVQLKPVKNNCYRQTQREATNLGVEVMNSKAQVKEKLGHVVQLRFAVCRKRDSKSYRHAKLISFSEKQYIESV